MNTTITEIKELVIVPTKKVKFSGTYAYDGAYYTIEGAQLTKDGIYSTGLTTKEERELEEALSMKKGELSKSNSSFWGHCLELRLSKRKPTTLVFDFSNPIEYIKYKVLTNRNDIASNEAEMLKFPKAEFFIDDKEAKAQIEEKKIDLEFELMDKFNELSMSEKRGYLKLYGRTGVNDVSDKIVKTELWKEAQKDPKKFIAFTTDKDIQIRIDIQDMLETGVIFKKNNFYNFGQEVKIGRAHV